MAKPTDPKPEKQPDHSMKEEEPLGWDEAPTGDEPEHEHRHPRQEGKGGTPDHEVPLDEAQGEADDTRRPDRSDRHGRD